MRTPFVVAVEQLHLVFEMHMPGATGDLRGIGSRALALREAENTASTVLPDAPPGLSRPTFSLSRPGVTFTGLLNVTVNTIVSYER